MSSHRSTTGSENRKVIRHFWPKQSRIPRDSPGVSSTSELSAARSIKVIDIDSTSDIRLDHMTTEQRMRLVRTAAPRLEVLNLKGVMTPQDLANITKFRAFPSLRKLDCSWHGVGFVDLMAILRKCPNLEELHAFVWTWRGSRNPRHHYVHRRLESLHLSGSISDPRLMLVTRLFPGLCNVSLLHAYFERKLGGRRLHILTNACLSTFARRYGPRLESLTVSSTTLHYRDKSRIATSQKLGVFDGIKRCTNLRRLHLKEADFVLSEKFVDALVRGCRKLEELRIEASQGLDNMILGKFADLPRLKRLALENMPSVDLNMGITALIFKGRLQQFSVYNTRVAPGCIQYCIRRCQNLRYLNLVQCGWLEVDDCLGMVKMYKHYGRAKKLLIRSDQANTWLDPRIWDAQLRIRKRDKRLDVEGSSLAEDQVFLEESAESAGEELPPQIVEEEDDDENILESSDDELEEPYDEGDEEDDDEDEMDARCIK